MVRSSISASFWIRNKKRRLAYAGWGKGWHCGEALGDGIGRWNPEENRNPGVQLNSKSQKPINNTWAKGLGHSSKTTYKWPLSTREDAPRR